MPELPEVETIKRGLVELLPGRQISSAIADWPKSFPNTPSDVSKFMVGAKVVNVRRRAKLLIIELSSGYCLVVHLKMTGQLVFVSRAARFGAGHPTKSLVAKLPDKSTRVTISFKDGSKLFFNDQRKFGWMLLVPTPEVINLDLISKAGPEPLSLDFTWQQLGVRLKKRSGSAIKAALLDQSVIAGIGNIYADESLWGAKIHPATRAGDLSPAEVRRLHREIKHVLKMAIDAGGSTDRNYVNAEGNTGSYLSFARVFRREGLSCPRCGHEVEKIRLNGRGTHFCPFCQR